MANFFRDGILFSEASAAPSPSKDYYQIVVTRNMVIFRWWKISLKDRGRLHPGEIKETHDDFLCDEKMHNDIIRVFSQRVFDYIWGLVNGHIDYLPRLPTAILTRILSHVDLTDVPSLCAVSKQFCQICRSYDFWEKFYSVHYGDDETKKLHAVAGEIGWRQLFFTSRLQLRLLLHRQLKTDRNGASDGNCKGDTGPTFSPTNPAPIEKESLASSPSSEHKTTEAVEFKSLGDNGEREINV